MIKTYESIKLCNSLSLTLPFGQAKVKIDFEHGNVSRGKHATYTTEDPFRQRVLDNAKENGMLYRLVRVMGEQPDAGIHEPTETRKTPVFGKEAQNPDTDENGEAAQAAYQAYLKAQEGKNADNPAAQQPDTEEAETPEAAPSKGTAMKDMKFGDASEVIIFVMEQWGEQAEDITAATKICRKHKINPVF